MNPPRAACYSRLYALPPHRTEPDGTPTWLVRGANFIVAISRARAGAVLARSAQPDEYLVFVPRSAATITHGTERVDAAADSLTIVPPGDSVVRASADGDLVRVFSSRASDLASIAANHDMYSKGTPEVAPLESWPEPVGGYRLRHYRIAEHAKPGSNMRVFRTRELMVNMLVRRDVPRDVRKLTPHSHADFEQGSVAIGGTYVHHCRYPWTPDMTTWRDDEHVEIGSPSVMVIPPTVIHTSQNIGTEPGWLFDVFAPPRFDFSLRPGVVCNADAYPMAPLPEGKPLPAGEAA